MVAFWISRFSSGPKRTLKLAAAGAFGVFIIGVLCFLLAFSHGAFRW